MGPIGLDTPLKTLWAGILEGLIHPWGPTIKCHGRIVRYKHYFMLISLHVVWLRCVKYSDWLRRLCVQRSWLEGYKKDSRTCDFLSLSCEWCNVENKKWNVEWAHVVLVFGERETRELLESESRELLESESRELLESESRELFESESWELLEKSATVRTILGVLSLVSGVWAAVHVLLNLTLVVVGVLCLFFLLWGSSQ